MGLPNQADALQLLFAEALAFFQSKDVVTPEEWDDLDDKAKRRAFSVAGVTKVNVLKTAWEGVERAIAKGESFDDFKKTIGPQLERSWGGSVAAPNWRVETIFRNNVQQAYSVGRYKVTTDPVVLAVRPYRMFDAVMDSRTSAVCSACDGTVLPADDPWWKGHLPPCHHACRSGFISLDKEQAQEMGVTKKLPDVAAGEGFGDLPSLDPVSPSAGVPAALANAVPLLPKTTQTMRKLHSIAELANLVLLSDEVVPVEGSEPPKEFRLFRAGANETTKGVFLFNEESQKSVMDAFVKHGAELVLDYEHKMLEWGARADDMIAAGWFLPELRDGELWATNVRWTPKATAHLRNAEWRYTSPAFVTGEDGRILELINTAITNLPATHGLDALVAAAARFLSRNPQDTQPTRTNQITPAEPAKKETSMKNILIALGLSESASEADAIVALSRLRDGTAQDKQAITQVLSIAETKTIEEAIGKVAGLRDEAAKVSKLSARVVELESGLRKKEVEAIVGEKVTAGFLTPANRDFAISLGMESPKAFDAYLATLSAQVIVNTSGGKDKPAKSAAKVALSKDERSIAARFGMSPKEFNAKCLSDSGDEPIADDEDDESEKEVALWPRPRSSAKRRRWGPCGPRTTMRCP